MDSWEFIENGWGEGVIGWKLLRGAWLGIKDRGGGKQS